MRLEPIQLASGWQPRVPPMQQLACCGPRRRSSVSRLPAVVPERTPWMTSCGLSETARRRRDQLGPCSRLPLQSSHGRPRMAARGGRPALDHDWRGGAERRHWSKPRRHLISADAAGGDRGTERRNVCGGHHGPALAVAKSNSGVRANCATMVSKSAMSSMPRATSIAPSRAAKTAMA